MDFLAAMVLVRVLARALVGLDAHGIVGEAAQGAVRFFQNKTLAIVQSRA